MACGVNPTNLIYATSVLKVELAAFMRKKNKPSSEGVDDLIAALRRLEERQAAQLRDATEFKPGELTPEEEKWVQEHGLNALNYIPQSTLQRHAEGWRNYQARHQSMTSAEIKQEKWAAEFDRRWKDRFDGFAYHMWLFLVAAFTWLTIDAHGWRMGIFACLLMLAVLELSYRLYSRS